MLISIIGPQCSGKKTIAQYLIQNRGFVLVKISNSHSSNPTSTPSSNSAETGCLSFLNADSLLEYATIHWRDQLVTLDLNTKELLMVGFDKRPFFLLVDVQAPVLLRWTRYLERSKTSSREPLTLEQFLEKDDHEIYGISNPSNLVQARKEDVKQGGIGSSSHTEIDKKTNPTSIEPYNDQFRSAVSISASRAKAGTNRNLSSSSTLNSLLQTTSLSILNNHSDLSTFQNHLSNLSIDSPHRLRPSWDEYFIKLCTLASLRSNCMKRRVGAILVSKNNRVISTGYNGTPRGLINCNQGGCERCNLGNKCGRNLDECLCLHAEENALLECGRSGGGVEGAVLYCNTCPCLRCAVKIVQTGVKEVIYQLEYSVDDRTKSIFQEAGVLFRKYQEPI